MSKLVFVKRPEYACDPDTFNNKVTTLIEWVNEHVKDANGKVEDIISPGNAERDLHVIKLNYELIGIYREVYLKNQELMDKEKSIHRIERQSYKRALLFRSLTTLCIGLGILFVYGLAQYLCINLPLMKVGA